MPSDRYLESLPVFLSYHGALWQPISETSRELRTRPPICGADVPLGFHDSLSSSSSCYSMLLSQSCNVCESIKFGKQENIRLTQRGRCRCCPDCSQIQKMKILPHPPSGEVDVLLEVDEPGFLCLTVITQIHQQPSS